MITKSILIIFLIECVLCSIAAIFATVWNSKNDVATNDYLGLLSLSKDIDGNWSWSTYFTVFLQTFFTWILLFTNMVPISLLVTVEIVKFAQANFIGWDINIYDTERDMPTRVQSSNLNEELGQITHIFSDKTGTLTANVMQFTKFSAGMISYGGALDSASELR